MSPALGSESLSPSLARRRGTLESLCHTASLREAKESPARSLKRPEGDSQPGAQLGALGPKGPIRSPPAAGFCQGRLRPSSIGLLFHVAGLLQEPLPLRLTHRQSECHLLEDAAHSHLQEPERSGLATLQPQVLAPADPHGPDPGFTLWRHPYLLKVKFLEHPDARFISLPDFSLKLGQT